MKFLKYSTVFLVIVLALWGALVLFMPKDNTFHVVLDPGHGGKDPGAVVGETYEKDIDLAIALMVRDLLSVHENITISMTREDDSYPTLTERADFANQKKADLYVSIHANSLDDETYSGVFTFYSPDKRSSKKPAEQIQHAVSNASGAVDRGVRMERYVVLQSTTMPAVLVEVGFMTCPEELESLVDPEYQAKLAHGITEGILIYKGA